jgi:hypothetical protein
MNSIAHLQAKRSQTGQTNPENKKGQSSMSQTGLFKKAVCPSTDEAPERSYHWSARQPDNQADEKQNKEDSKENLRD